MRTFLQNTLVIIIILAFGRFVSPGAMAQSTGKTTTKKTTTQGKTTSTKSGSKTTAKTGSKGTSSPQYSKTGTKQQTGKGGSKAGAKDAPKPGALPADKIDPLREQATGLVKFFESTLNFLADKSNTVQDKQVIINESYLKFFWDSEVQIEDDLDKHLVPLYKDVQAYLTDVDFFFKQAKFTYNVQDLSVMTNELGNTFFKVTCNRNITGINLNGDNVNNNQVRYIEINYDESKQQLKIVSIYTTKLNEKDDLRNWWNGLSQGWQLKLGKDLQLGNGLSLGQVNSFNDTTAMVAGQPVLIDKDAYYKGLMQIVGLKTLDLSGDVMISDLSPLTKLSALEEVNLKGTPISDLMPLRNLNNLKSLNISNTSVSSLEPLHYCTHIQQLFIRGTGVPDLGELVNFPGLSDLDISNTKVKSLSPIQDLTFIDDLRLSGTAVTDLSPIKGLVKLELLNISSTGVSDLAPLKDLEDLRILMADSTGISSLKPLESLGSLQKVYCDYTKLPKAEAIEFMITHPSTSLVFESAALTKWWSGMTSDWQNLLSNFTELSNPPTKEQLHRLILVDSLNVTGRMNIKSLEAASMLSLLRVLYASSTGVSDITPLKNLIKLQVLYLNNTSVSSLQPLSVLQNMKVISIENTQVADLSPLDGMENLHFVYADNSQVVLKEANRFLDKNHACLLIFQSFENNNWWKGLTKAWQDVFTGALNMKGAPNKLQLQQIANLDELSISENFSISDLTPLQKLSRLTSLTFSGTTVNTLEPLRGMSTLETLNCGKNPISDLTPVAGLSKLTDLDFSSTQVKELEPIQAMTQLTSLKFSGTPVTRIKYIAGLVNLSVLEFYNTKVSSLDDIDALRNLTSLKIFRTNISQKKVDKFKTTHPKCEVVFY